VATSPAVTISRNDDGDTILNMNTSFPSNKLSGSISTSKVALILFAGKVTSNGPGV